MKYEFNSRIRYSELDEDGKLSVNGLVNYFQDVSTFQSEQLGVGVEYLKKRHQAWILSFWQIVYDRPPRLGELVTAQTWAYDFKGFMGLRNFALLDQKRTMLARANSVWALFDMEKQRPARMEPEMAKLYETEPPLDMEYASRKISLPEGGEPEVPFYIGKNQLDTNHHVNNGQYIAMAAAYLPEGFAIRELRAEYRMQARLRDEIFPVVCRQKNTVTVELCNGEGKPYAVVMFLQK